MLKFSVRKKLSRILAGTLSAAMAMTMVPEIWLPVYADSVRNNILNTDIVSEDDEIIEDTEFVSEDIPEDAAEPEFEEYEFNGHKYAYFP